MYMPGGEDLVGDCEFLVLPRKWYNIPLVLATGPLSVKNCRWYDLRKMYRCRVSSTTPYCKYMDCGIFTRSNFSCDSEMSGLVIFDAHYTYSLWRFSKNSMDSDPLYTLLSNFTGIKLYWKYHILEKIRCSPQLTKFIESLLHTSVGALDLVHHVNIEIMRSTDIANSILRRWKRGRALPHTFITHHLSVGTCHKSTKMCIQSFLRNKMQLTREKKSFCTFFCSTRSPLQNMYVMSLEDLFKVQCKKWT